jgi:hypothetical protein
VNGSTMRLVARPRRPPQKSTRPSVRCPRSGARCSSSRYSVHHSGNGSAGYGHGRADRSGILLSRRDRDGAATIKALGVDSATALRAQ